MAFANPAGNIFTKSGKKGRHTQSGMAAFASKAHPTPLPVWLGAFADMPKFYSLFCTVSFSVSRFSFKVSFSSLAVGTEPSAPATRYL